jgi:predicted small secreted protein
MLDGRRGASDIHPVNNTKGPSPMRKLIVFAAATAALLVAACNTIQGMGRDIQAAGHAVSGTAEDVKR